jgi:hypothetical protein
MATNDPRHFLAYWLPSTLKRNLDRGLTRMNHSASDQFDKLRAGGGDTVWLVTANKGKLILIGRIQVGKILNQKAAERELKKEQDGVWEATYHIRPKGRSRKVLVVDITAIAKDLRFQSDSGKDRLTVRGRQVNPDQLQKMRRLSPESALLLKAVIVGAGGD